MSKRPRPRPRAKVSAPAPASSTPSQKGAPVASGSKSNTIAVVDSDEEDSFIIKRNIHRTRNWGQEVTEEKEVKNAQSTPRQSSVHEEYEEGEESPEEIRSPPKTQYGTKVKALPSWARGVSAPRNVRGRSNTHKTDSSDSDADSVTLRANRTFDHDATPRAGPSRPHKRQKSRSRSLTPPPQLDASVVNYTRNLVRQELKINNFNHNASAALDLTNDSDDEEELDPDLLRIKQQVARQERKRRGESVSSSEGEGGEDKVNDRADMIQLNVKWLVNPHDKDALIIPDDALSQAYGRNHTFHDLFTYIAEITGFEESSLVLHYEGIRVYPGATPASVKIWRGSADITASDLATFKAIQEQKYAPAEPEPEERERSPSVVVSEAEGGDGKIKLTLKSSAAEVVVKVKTSSTCADLLALFFKKSGLAPPSGNRRAAVIFDGEKQAGATTLVDLELEDDDLLEIFV